MTPPVDVHVHVHHAVTGALPLRVADLLFTGRELIVAEYARVTPVGIALGRPARASERAGRRLREDGPAGLIEIAERTRRVPYGEIERVRVHDSRLARPKVAVDVASGPPYACRVHAPVDVDALSGALCSLGDRRGFRTETHATPGISPRNTLRRIAADR